jgi:hypothetical protein
MRTQIRTSLWFRSGLCQAHRTGGNGVDISAVNAAIAVDIPTRVEGSSRLDPARQCERVEDIDTPVVVDVFAHPWVGGGRVAETFSQPKCQRQTRRHRRPRQPGFPTRLGLFQPLQMFPGPLQHGLIHGWRNENAFLLKKIQGVNQLFRRLEAFIVPVLVWLGHTMFDDLSARKVEKVHFSKNVRVRGS